MIHSHVNLGLFIQNKKGMMKSAAILDVDRVESVNLRKPGKVQSVEIDKIEKRQIKIFN